MTEVQQTKSVVRTSRHICEGSIFAYAGCIERLWGERDGDEPKYPPTQCASLSMNTRLNIESSWSPETGILQDSWSQALLGGPSSFTMWSIQHIVPVWNELSFTILIHYPSYVRSKRVSVEPRRRSLPVLWSVLKWIVSFGQWFEKKEEKTSSWWCVE